MKALTISNQNPLLNFTEDEVRLYETAYGACVLCEPKHFNIVINEAVKRGLPHERFNKNGKTGVKIYSQS